MKTKDELDAIKEEIDALNEKLAELTEEELAQVTGGVKHDIEFDVHVVKTNVDFT